MTALAALYRSSYVRWRFNYNPLSFKRVIVIVRIVLAIVTVGAAAQAEAQSQVEQTTQGLCSPAVTGTEGNITIVCSGIDSRALARLNDLLDKRNLEVNDKVREAEEWASRHNILSRQLAE